MFERFTERARQVVVLAQDEARALKHNYIGTEHLLLGLLREEQGAGGRVLQALDVRVEEARTLVVRIGGQGDEITTGQIPFTPHALKVLELSLREALSLGDDYIGTEHVLLGIVSEGTGVASQVLQAFGLDAERVRQEVIRSVVGAPLPAYEQHDEVTLTDHWPPPWTGYGPVERLGDEVAPQRADEPMLLRGILIGWALAVVTLGGGLVVGWLIWG
jgi:ATP-dependent Clp protease ATP-binding subunit ClpA